MIKNTLKKDIKKRYMFYKHSTMYEEANFFSSELSSSQRQKFLPGLRVVPEHAGHVAGDSFRSLLLHSPHHHAHVPF